jgi:hypothetical protein
MAWSVRIVRNPPWFNQGRNGYRMPSENQPWHSLSQAVEKNKRERGNLKGF